MAIPELPGLDFGALPAFIALFGFGGNSNSGWAKFFSTHPALDQR